MTVYIYSLKDPRDGMCRYVGKTVDMYHRLISHRRDGRNNHKCNWIKSLRAIGLSPVMEVLEEIPNSNDMDWQEREVFWIEEMRRRGFDLTNLDSGGKAGKRLADSTKRLLSFINTGKKLSIETRKKISAVHKGRPHSPEHAQKIGDARKGMPRPAYVLMRMREGRMAKPITAQERANHAAALQRRRDRGDPSVTIMTDEKKKKISQSLIGQKMAESACIKMSASQKKRWDRNRASGNTGFKITDMQALEIFYAQGPQHLIAKNYGITQTLVSMIKLKKTRAHIHREKMVA